MQNHGGKKMAFPVGLFHCPECAEAHILFIVILALWRWCWGVRGPFPSDLLLSLWTVVCKFWLWAAFQTLFHTTSNGSIRG